MDHSKVEISGNYPTLNTTKIAIKKSKYTESQIVFALQQAQTGTPVGEVCRKMGISEATFYNWKKKFGGLGTAELQHLYLSIYKSASIFIHSETGILTDNFVQINNGQIGPQMAYLFTNLVNVALIDIIQYYEVVKFIKPDKTQGVQILYSDYSEELAKDYKLIFEP